MYELIKYEVMASERGGEEAGETEIEKVFQEGEEGDLFQRQG